MTFPGAALVIFQDTRVAYAKAYGTLKYEDANPVTLNTLFDLASLTKPLVTTLCLMKLYVEGRLFLSKIQLRATFRMQIPRYAFDTCFVMRVGLLRTFRHG